MEALKEEYLEKCELAISEKLIKYIIQIVLVYSYSNANKLTLVYSRCCDKMSD